MEKESYLHSGKSVSVMIVDDSGFMRLALRKMLERDTRISIVADVANGEEALRLHQRLCPDVITMDVEMPGMGGLEVTRRILAERDCAIIMVSSLTHADADTTIRAMQIGAVDFIPKVSSFVDLDIVKVERELLRKVHFWAGRRSTRPSQDIADAGTPRVSTLPPARRSPAGKPDLVVIGASTGGPRVIPTLFQKMRPMNCPVVIALHMPPIYTESFARHLRNGSGHNAVEGQDGMRLEPGQVVVIPGGQDGRIEPSGYRGYILRLFRDSKSDIHPSVNALFHSAAECVRSPVAVILTGMGEDGKHGAEALSRRRTPVLAQCAEDCLVYGMPRAIIEAGAASESLSLDQIACRLDTWLPPLGGKPSGRRNDHG